MSEIFVKNAAGYNGVIVAHFIFPDGYEAVASVRRDRSLWWVDSPSLSKRALRWIQKADKESLTPSEVKRLKAAGELRFPVQVADEPPVSVRTLKKFGERMRAFKSMKADLEDLLYSLERKTTLFDALYEFVETISDAEEELLNEVRLPNCEFEETKKTP